MSRIKGKNTGIELAMIKILKRAKIRYRKHPKIGGNPDFILPDSKTLIFCDGEFWHGKDYIKREPKLPDYWKTKILRNMRRDKATTRRLRRAEWRVVRFWGNDILKNEQKVIARLNLCKVSCT